MCHKSHTSQRATMRAYPVLSLTVVITTFLVEFTTVQPSFAGCIPRFQCGRPRIFPNVCQQTRYIIIPHGGELNVSGKPRGRNTERDLESFRQSVLEK